MGKAEGYQFPFINTPYEGRTWLLVYDRENRLPGASQNNTSKDRDILYRIPLPLKRAPKSLLVKDGLLIADGSEEGVVVLSIADPLKPTVVRKITQGLKNGIFQDLDVADVAVIQNRLYVTTEKINFTFDLTKPSLPQLGAQPAKTYFGIQTPAAEPDTLAFGLNGLELINFTNPNDMHSLAHYVDNGFPLPGNLVEMDAVGTITAQLREQVCGVEQSRQFIALMDSSRLDIVSVLDALAISDCARYSHGNGYVAAHNYKEPVHYGDDGVVAFVTPGFGFSQLKLMDTLTPDFVSSNPAEGAVGVARDLIIRVKLTHPIHIPPYKLKISIYRVICHY